MKNSQKKHGHHLSACLVAALLLGSSVLRCAQQGQQALFFTRAIADGRGIELVSNPTVCLFAQDKVEPLRQTLFHDPQKVIRKTEALIKAPNAAIKNYKQPQKKADASAQESILESLRVQFFAQPLFMFRECTTDYCPLNRTRYCHRRPFVENAIVQNIKKQHVNRDLPLSVSFFAPGDMLSELTIATKIVHAGYKNVTVNLIGPCSKQIFDDLMACNGAIPIQQKYTEQNDGSLIVDKTMALNLNCYRFAALLYWLSSQNQEANVRVRIFKDSCEFAQACKTNPAFRTDAYVSIDMLEDSREAMCYAAPYQFLDSSFHVTKPNAAVYTCSRATPVCTAAAKVGIITRLLDRLTDRKTDEKSIILSPEPATPVLEVLTKNRDRTAAETSEFEQQKIANGKRDYGFLHTLGYLQCQAPLIFKCQRVHLPETKIAAGIVVSLGTALVGAMAAVVYKLVPLLLQH